MKKLILLSSLLICTLILMGQNKWSFGASLHAGFSGYSSNDYQYYPDVQFGDYSYTSEEKLQPSMGAGLWLERRLKNRWGIHLGLDYLQSSSFARSESVNYTPEGAMSFFNQSDLHLSQQQLQLPLEIHFFLGRSDRSWQPFLSAGTQLQYLLSQINTTENFYGAGGQFSESYTYSEKTDLSAEYYDYSRWQLGLNAAIGLSDERWSISIRHSWTRGKSSNNYLSCDCFCGLGINSYCPHAYYGDLSAFKQLRQFDLRLQYRF